MTIRPRRSVLYMPGSNTRAMEKAKSLAADGLIFDLEDAVGPDAKADAREKVAAALGAGGFGRREIIVRINGLDTPWGIDDLDAVCKAGPHAILVPKVSSPSDVARASEQLGKRDPDLKISLWLMMETPLAVLNSKDIAASSKGLASRLSCLVMGTNDLAKELHAAEVADRAPLVPALAVCVLAASAYGLAILDGVFNNVKDLDGFTAQCRHGAELGFDGKTLIHPSQIEACNRIYAPKPEEVAWSRKVIAAFDLPENRPKGAISLDGKMVERLHVEQARRLVELADSIAAAEDAR